jgi:hypothetical protein
MAYPSNAPRTDDIELQEAYENMVYSPSTGHAPRTDDIELQEAPPRIFSECPLAVSATETRYGCARKTVRTVKLRFRADKTMEISAGGRPIRIVPHTGCRTFTDCGPVFFSPGRLLLARHGGTYIRRRDSDGHTYIVSALPLVSLCVCNVGRIFQVYRPLPGFSYQDVSVMYTIDCPHIASAKRLLSNAKHVTYEGLTSYQLIRRKSVSDLHSHT